MISNATYEDKIGAMLLSLEIEKPFVLFRSVAPENRVRFAAAVKNYIDNSLGWDQGWEIIFKNDYSELKKIERMLINNVTK